MQLIRTDATGNQALRLGREADGDVRAEAVAADASSAHFWDLSSVWSALASGTIVVVDPFTHGRRSYLLLREATEQYQSRGMTDGQSRLLERVLLGQSQKAVAIEQGLSPSTVATTSGEGLRAVGVPGVASRAPIQLALIVHAHHFRQRAQYARASRFRAQGVEYRVLSTMAPDVALGDKLSCAERAVCCLRLDGMSHASIAKVRGTSARTVANQLAAACRKLGVSGRAELMAYLARTEALVFHDREASVEPDIAQPVN